MAILVHNKNEALKNFLFAGAAVFAASASNAADLPSGKSGPVSYVKICDAYGAGFFTLPGSDTCLKIGGFVRVEYQYAPGKRVYSVATGAVTQVAGAQDTSGSEVRAQIILDARTPTELGTARTYIRMRALNVSGIRSERAPGNFDTAYSSNGNRTTITLERAFVTLNGFTFGNMSSEYAGLWPSGSVVGGSADFTPGWNNGIKGVSYVKKFGDWTAALEIHDQADTAVQNGSGVPAGLLAPTATNSLYLHTPRTGYNGAAVIRNEGAWGGIEVGAVVGNNSTSDGPFPSANGPKPLLGSRTYFSWAVESTLQIKLPMIAAGDEFFLNVGYSKGANGYAAAPDTVSTLVNDAGNKRILGGILIAPSSLSLTTIDAAGNPLTYGQERVFQATALFTHYWMPAWRSHFSAAYINYSTPTAFNPVGGLNTQIGKVTVWAAKGNLIYSPAKNFDIGVEAGYGRMNAKIQNPTVAYVAAGSPGLREGNWTTKFRVQRGF